VIADVIAQTNRRCTRISAAAYPLLDSEQAALFHDLGTDLANCRVLIAGTAAATDRAD
jgi:hypothetical protein